MKRFLILLFVLTMLKHANSQQWSFEYPCGENEYAHFMAGDKSLHYNYVVGGIYGDNPDLPSAIALCIRENGEYNDKVFKGNSMKMSFITALGLNDGNVFVAAACTRKMFMRNCGLQLWIRIWIYCLKKSWKLMNIIFLMDYLHRHC